MSASLAWVTALSASVPIAELAPGGEVERLVERAAGEAEAAAPTVTRNRLSTSMPMRKPSPGAPTIAVGGDADRIVGSRAERMRRDDLDPLRDRDRFGGHDERRQSARSVALAGAREGQVEVGDPAVGDVGLLARAG